MNTVEETKIRLEIATDISKQLEGIVRGVLLGGSMGFGQNFSVTNESDIDMVVVCDKEKLPLLEKTKYFSNQVPKNISQMFMNDKINVFWVIKEVNKIEVNTFVYETNAYVDFCTKLKGKLKLYIPTKPSSTQIQPGFDGKDLTFERNVQPFEGGFLYEKPALANGKFWGGPPRSDFLTGSHILYQQDSFLNKTSNQTWNAAIQQLKKEYGPNPDLKKYNILYSDYCYQKKPHKLPESIKTQITQETIKRIDAHK